MSNSSIGFEGGHGFTGEAQSLLVEPQDYFRTTDARSYLAIGNDQPDVGQLLRIDAAIERAQMVPSSEMLRGAIYLDIALQGGSVNRRLACLETAELHFMRTELVDASNNPEQDLHARFNASMYGAYLEKYRQYVEGRPSTIEAETRLYDKLLNLALTLSIAKPEVGDRSKRREFYKARQGILFEASMHLLSSRFNLRYNSVLQHAWPSLPREDRPIRTKNANVLSGWDMAISGEGFYDYNSATFIQLKNHANHKQYAPFITVLRSKVDLGVASSGEIVRLAHIESHSPERLQRISATHRLDEIEKSFYTAIGWQYEASDQ